MRRLAALAVVLAALPVLSGCGSKPSLSLVQLRQQATAICTATARRTGRLTPPASAPAAAGFLDRGATLLAEEARALRKLQAPAGTAPAYARALASLDATIAGLRAEASALRRGDPSIEIRRFGPQIPPLETRQTEAFQELGMPACGAH